MRPIFSDKTWLTLVTAGSFTLLSATTTFANGDWHRWRGPNLDGISTEKNWSSQWPSEGPKVLWRAAIGTGFSSISVSNGRVYTIGNKANSDTVFCFNADTGKVLWQHDYNEDLDPKYYDGGPSTTPTVDGDTVYSLSRKGKLFGLEAASGKVLWQKDLVKELGVGIPEWGFAGSPLVWNDWLILNLGTHGTAVEKKTGKVVWTTGKDAAGYSTPLPFTIGNQSGIAIFAAKGLVAIDPKTGKELWSHPWKTSYDVNAADPIFSGDHVFISSGYGTGGGLLKVSGNQVTEVWKSKDMHNQFNSCVLIGGYLYGVSGQNGQKSELRCVEFKTGKVMWSEPSVMFGSLMAADGKLVVLGEKGELIIAEASPKAFNAISRAQVLGGRCWTAPVLSNGKIYARNAKGDFICVDVSSKSAMAR